jgi:hypothetical protein
MSTAELERIIAKNGDVSWRSIEGNCVLLHLVSGVYYTLDSVGRFIWESLDGEKPLADVLKEVLDRYDVEETKAREDLLEIVDDLLREELALTVEKDPQAPDAQP